MNLSNLIANLIEMITSNIFYVNQTVRIAEHYTEEI